MFSNEIEQAWREFGQRGLSRRGFLLGSGVAVAGIAVGGWLATRLTDGQPEALVPGRTLAAAEQQMFATVTDALLDGSLSDDADARAGQIRWIVERMDAGILLLPALMQDETLKLLKMLTVAPTRALLIGQWEGWSSLSREQTLENLQSLSRSEKPLQRVIYRVFRDFVYGTYYGDRRSWASIGFAGPVIDNGNDSRGV